MILIFKKIKAYSPPSVLNISVLKNNKISEGPDCWGRPCWLEHRRPLYYCCINRLYQAHDRLHPLLHKKMFVSVCKAQARFRDDYLPVAVGNAEVLLLLLFRVKSLLVIVNTNWKHCEMYKESTRFNINFPNADAVASLCLTKWWILVLKNCTLRVKSQKVKAVKVYLVREADKLTFT